MTYKDKYSKELTAIYQHIGKVRNRSLRVFLYVFVQVIALQNETIDQLPIKELDKNYLLGHIENIHTILKIAKNNSSERTAYDIQHGIVAINKTDELATKILSDLGAAIRNEVANGAILSPNDKQVLVEVSA